MIAGSNYIQFRMVNLQTIDGQVAGTKLQVRTKEISKNQFNNFILADNWSDWQDINMETITELI